MQVYFYECTGEDAKEKLETLQQTLEQLSFIQSTKLLKNTKQADLFLLVVEASEEPHIETPEGTRVWTFTEVASSQ
jgi:hypothetical protein